MDTIFLVEDDMNIRRLTGMHLQLAGYDVRELEDAAAAREALKSQVKTTFCMLLAVVNLKD